VRRGIWITVLAVVAFVAIVIARLPASWVVPTSPAAVACTEVDGTIWSGACGGFTAEGIALGDLAWNVHALSLLTGKLSAYIVLTRRVGSVRGDVAVGLDKSVTVRNMQASLPFDQDLKRLVPALQSLSGSTNADIAFAHYAKDFVTRIQGRIEVHDLVSSDRTGVTPLGSYAVTFPAATSGEPMGQLQDLG